ncbi:AzlD domain-containing protein [uncultured Pseudokineococcus sp.]|uniref:AzlD domain-containing protein n=1 Tax=uncultured Pseudokineococcus sp. TaxID=1642928 RepID=UPI00260C18E6|nr:AzlD domain-containing protein [uncultured Pseudokineococcus sp.]
MTWLAVLLGALGCYLCKLAGGLLPESVLASPRVQRVTGALPVVLLAALVATQTVGDGRALVLDPRVAGVGAGLVAALLRAPFLLVVAVAAGTAAVVRLLV